MSPDKVSAAVTSFDPLVCNKLIDEIKITHELTFYLKQPLPGELVEELNRAVSREAHFRIEVVVEDFRDAEHLRKLHAAGFSLFCGLGLPTQSVAFLGSNRGFLLGSDRVDSSSSLRELNNPEEIYFKLLWRRFGHAVVLSGWVKDRDAGERLICLVGNDENEVWCRHKEELTIAVPGVGAKIEIFAWEKWLSHILEILELRVIEPRARPR
jgi:hypothetical protein